MASTAMHQHHQLDGGHQSNRAAPNGRHHLSSSSGVASSYHNQNHNQNHQYNSSYHQEDSPSRVARGNSSIRDQQQQQQQHYACNGGNQLHQLQHNGAHTSEQANVDGGHFYNPGNFQAATNNSSITQNSNQYGHYHYTAANIDAAGGYATQATSVSNVYSAANNNNHNNNQQLYDLSSNGDHQAHHLPAFDHYACNPHYSFIQSFNVRAVQNPSLHQPYAVYTQANETSIDHQQHQSYHPIQETDQGQSVDSNHGSSRGIIKIERNGNSAPSHKQHNISEEFDRGETTVLTELGPKTLSQRNGFVTEEHDSKRSALEKNDSVLRLKKRRKLPETGYSAKEAANDTDNNIIINSSSSGSNNNDDCDENYTHQLDNSYARDPPHQSQSEHQQHHVHHSLTTTSYLDSVQRPLKVAVGEHEHEQTATRIDRSSAGGGSGGGCSLSGVFDPTKTLQLDDSNERLTHQGYPAHPAESSASLASSLSPADPANHRLGRYQATTTTASYQAALSVSGASEDEAKQLSPDKQTNSNNEFNQLRILEMRKEKSRDAARSRRSKENHEFYELAKLLPLPAAITSQLDFLDKASIIRLTISFLKLRQFSVNGHPPWAPDFTTLGSINPYSSQSLSNYAEHYSSSTGSQDEPQSRPTSAAGIGKQKSSTPSVPTPSSSVGLNLQQQAAYSSSGLSNEPVLIGVPSSLSSVDRRLQAPPSSVAFSTIDPYRQQQPLPTTCQQDGTLSLMSEKNLSKNSTVSLFDIHQGTHILQSLDGFAFAIGRDGRFLYISETVSMYLGLSQVEMTGSSVFDYTHQQDHEELSKQLGIPFATSDCNQDGSNPINSCETPPPNSVNSHYSAASNETSIDDYVNSSCSRKRAKTTISAQQQSGTTAARGAYGRNGKRTAASKRNLSLKIEASTSDVINTNAESSANLASVESTQSLLNSSRDGNGRLEPSQGTSEDPLVRQFCIRMKSTLTKRGCQHFKSSGYRVVHVVAHLRAYQSNDHGHLMDPLDEAVSLSGGTLKQPKRRGPKLASSNNKDGQTASKDQLSKVLNDHNATSDTNQGERVPTKQKIIGMVAVAIALPPPSINELRLESDTFVLRLGLDLRVTHIEPKITDLLHFPIDLIAGRSLYSLIHPADIYQVQKCHKDLLRKGQMMSGYYRLLARNGGYIWIQTCATLICNNTLGQTTAILPANSPMPTQSSTHLTHRHGDHHLRKMPNYLAPPTMVTNSDLNPAASQYNLSGGGSSSHSKMMSPSLNSHLGGSQYETQDQDQCVIFVNHMITNIVESDEILDVCQSPNYTPLSSFSGNITSNICTSSSSIMFNSPSSSCSSPCIVGSLKSNNTSICGKYASPATPNNSVNLSSPRRQHIIDEKTIHHSSSRETKAANGRRSAATATATTTNNHISKMKPQIYLSRTSDENGHDGHINAHTNFNNMTTGEQIKVADTNNSHYDSTGADTAASNCVYGYSQTPGSVNLALSKVHQAEPAWLGHQQTAVATAGRLSDASAIVYGTGGGQAAGSDHYTTMNRSIYKAAFGLDVSGSNYSHQQAATAVYPTNTPTAYPPTATVVTNGTWDTTAAVAAVAAATNLTNHHHHHNTNPYAHLESHHQNAHTLSSAAAAAANHHTSAGSYYNYYGYYGNKFI